MIEPQDEFKGEYLVSGMKDNIDPKHYTSFSIPPNVYITENKLEWEVGNIIKYVTRYEMKNGLEDLRKAQKYLELLIERKYRDSN